MQSPSKISLRRSALKRRRGLPASYRRHASMRALQALQPLATLARYTIAYAPIGAELDVARPAGADCLGPACLVPSPDLSPIAQAHAWRRIWPKRHQGFVLVLVPGVAFTACGHRLGRGAGYYDQLLSHLPKNHLRVGVAFCCQLVAYVPQQAHDMAMHAVLTERGLRFAPSFAAQGHPPIPRMAHAPAKSPGACCVFCQSQ